MFFAKKSDETQPVPLKKRVEFLSIEFSADRKKIDVKHEFLNFVFFTKMKISNFFFMSFRICFFSRLKLCIICILPFSLIDSTSSQNLININILYVEYIKSFYKMYDIQYKSTSTCCFFICLLLFYTLGGLSTK